MSNIPPTPTPAPGSPLKNRAADTIKLEITQTERWLLAAAIFVLATDYGEDIIAELFKAKKEEINWDDVVRDLDALIEKIGVM